MCTNGVKVKLKYLDSDILHSDITEQKINIALKRYLKISYLIW